MDDGFMLVYVKEKKAHAVGMSKEQWNTLQALISTVIFKNEKIQVIDEDMGDVYNMSVTLSIKKAPETRNKIPGVVLPPIYHP